MYRYCRDPFPAMYGFCNASLFGYRCSVGILLPHQFFISMNKKKPVKNKQKAIPETTVEELQQLINKHELQTMILKQIIENNKKSTNSSNK
jgi:hypothetical protein